MTGPQTPVQAPAGQKTTLDFPFERVIKPWLNRHGETLLYIGEVLLIFIWSLYVGAGFLNFNPQAWPTGREYPSSISTNYIWTLLPKCGTCIFWNGFQRGGAPAFADTFGSMLHPLVILATLIWGVVNGTKAVLLASLFIAGFAQWWLTKIMGLGRIARLFCGAMAVVGGHLAARMELGPVGLVLSTAASSLVIAPGLALALTGKRRYTILLALALSSAVLSGQGYLQVGLAMAILPAFLIFMFDSRLRLKPVWKEFLLAGILTLLLSAILLVPLLHFYPNTLKETDPAFAIAQPLAYVPLNEVINDVSFYYNTSLKLVPYPYLYANYIGWVPVLLAFLALRFIPRAYNRVLAYFLLAIGLVYLCAGAVTLKALAYILPATAAGVRNPSTIAGLANPLILGLAAWGLDALVRMKWPRLGFLGTEAGISVAWLILTIPLLWSLKSAYDFGHPWLQVAQIDPGGYLVTQAMKTDSTQWVNLPFGEHYWMIPALDSGLKMGFGIRPWDWKDHQPPPVALDGTRDPVDPSTPNFVQFLANVSIVAHPENQYAYIQAGQQQIPCRAQALGGKIDVNCPTAPAGQLVVEEYRWDGWAAWLDGKRAPLLSSSLWLSVAAPAGQHTYQLRYRPWDVWAGLLLTLAGLAACVMLWLKTIPGELNSQKTRL